MNKTFKIPLVAAMLATASLTAAAEGARFAPLFTDPNFKLEPTVAAVVGAMKPEDVPSDLFAGIELNFNCGLFQTADNRMRTHLVVGQYDKAGLDLTTVELSPRYTMPVGKGFSVGVGPGVALVRSEVAGQKASHAALMVAGGVNYRNGAYYAGVDLRYQDTNDKRVGGVTREADNWLLAAKVGINF
jgi:hypothetical protein